MNRLTREDGIWRYAMDSDTINALYKRLAAYENSGLEPSEVQRLACILRPTLPTERMTEYAEEGFAILKHQYSGFEAINQLAAYEDSNMSPDQIAELVGKIHR